jgi:hypothetical protein
LHLLCPVSPSRAAFLHAFKAFLERLPKHININDD